MAHPDRRAGRAHRRRPPAQRQRGHARAVAPVLRRGRRHGRRARGRGGLRAGRGRVRRGRAHRTSPPRPSSRGILKEANRRIYELAASDESHRGMGTTLTAAKVVGDEVSLGHVGDSRAYLLRDGRLEQLTRDHSLVAELERTGPDHRGGGREPSPALDHHAGARARVERGGGHLHRHRPRRRHLPDLLRRAHGHGGRRGARRPPAGARPRSRRRPRRSCAPRTRAAAATTSPSCSSAWATTEWRPRRRLDGEDAGTDAEDTIAGTMRAEDVRAAARTRPRRCRSPPRPPDTPPPAAPRAGPPWPSAWPGRRPTPPWCARPTARPSRRAPRRRGARGPRARPPGGGPRAPRRGGRRAVRAQPAGLLRGHQRRRPRHRLPRHPVRAAVRHRPLQAGVRQRRAGAGHPRVAQEPRARPLVAQPRGRRGPRAPGGARPAGPRIGQADVRALEGAVRTAPGVAAGGLRASPPCWPLARRT